MKIVYKEKIGEYTIIRFITDAQVDVEATKRASGMNEGEITDEILQRMLTENPVYARVGEEATVMDDECAARCQAKLDLKGEHQVLLDTGEFWPDYRGVEYWINQDGWAKEKIEEIGVYLPAGAVLTENLSPEQQQEISTQNEAQRISSLTPEQRDDEKQTRLKALAREANQKAEDAELLDEEFDKQTWFQTHKAEIEALYAA